MIYSTKTKLDMNFLVNSIMNIKGCIGYDLNRINLDNYMTNKVIDIANKETTK